MPTTIQPSAPSSLPLGESVQEAVVAGREGEGGSIKAFFKQRWRGTLPLRVLVVRDMLILGTLANLVATIASLAVLANGAPTWAGIAVFLLPFPDNLFIFSCVWRVSGRIGGAKGTFLSVAAVFWLVGATIL
jgi:hypothetical protein